jgi:hypothetical protein
VIFVVYVQNMKFVAVYVVLNRTAYRDARLIRPPPLDWLRRHVDQIRALDDQGGSERSSSCWGSALCIGGQRVASGYWGRRLSENCSQGAGLGLVENPADTPLMFAFAGLKDRRCRQDQGTYKKQTKGRKSQDAGHLLIHHDIPLGAVHMGSMKDGAGF